jgi:hypothetical protein
MLASIVLWLTLIWAAVYLPIETYIDWTADPSFSQYAVNVFGVAIALWGVLSLRRARPYAEGLLATGWGWTTAVFWRGTNLRFRLAADGQQLYFGRVELWLGPTCTLIAGAALVCSLVLLLKRGSQLRGG